jgi:hypothetical protein
LLGNHRTYDSLSFGGAPSDAAAKSILLALGLEGRVAGAGAKCMRAMRELPVVPICRRRVRLPCRANHNDPLAHPASIKRDVSADRHDA